MKKSATKLIEFTFILPALVLFVLVVLIPFCQGFPISFTKWDGMSAERTYVGISNYVRIFSDPHFRGATMNTFYFTIVTLVASNLIGLMAALLIHRATRLNNVIRTLVFMPYCLSLVLASYIWRYLFNDLLYAGLGILSPLATSSFVMVGLSIISIWQDAGYCMVVYIAALQAIPTDYYEAAEIDGSSRMRTFRKITLPLLGPAITTNVTLLIAWGMKVFDYPMAATSGGPGRASETLAMLIYNNLFTYFRAGYGQAIAIVFTLIIFIISTSVASILRAREVEL